MAEAPIITKAPTLSEQYLLKDKEDKADAGTKPVEVKEVDNALNAAPVDVVNEKSEGSAVVSPAAEENSVVTSDAAAAGESTEAGSKAEESNETVQGEGPGDQEDAELQPVIKIETAPADFRFPTTNQTRHCFTRYVEYHRCVAAKGEDASQCNKFAKYYRALCPGEWVDRWNEQRENGTFPGPL